MTSTLQTTRDVLLNDLLAVMLKYSIGYSRAEAILAQMLPDLEAGLREAEEIAPHLEDPLANMTPEEREAHKKHMAENYPEMFEGLAKSRGKWTNDPR